MRLFIDLTPLILLSLGRRRRGGETKKEAELSF